MKSHFVHLVSVVLPLSASLTLAACATKPPIPEVKYDDLNFDTAVLTPEPEKPVKLVSMPKPLPLPGQLKRIDSKGDEKNGDTRPPQTRVIDANKAAKMEPAKDGYINAIQHYPYVKGALYQLYAAVNQVSDIALQPGEKLVSVSAGDTVRWVVGDTNSGEGSLAQVHILVKPIAPDLQTNLVIATDRRTYHLELHSTDKTYMASVSWAYPESDLTALKKQNQRAGEYAKLTIDQGLKLDRLRFRYRITGDAPWKPVRAFDDGEKVYIQFPSGLRQGEAPPLFVIGSTGEPALVNYRVKGTYYVVDRLFAAAELRLGTDPQRIVRITRTDATYRTARSKKSLWGIRHDR
ncbi:MAG: P-type conjugative transfer protein TrbG [Rhizobiaceae bacterium]